MKVAEVGARVTLKNILFLTDFSEPSEAALPFAAAVAREYGCKIYALHVLTPTMYTYAPPELIVETIAAQEEAAEKGMLLLTAKLAGLPFETNVERGIAIWPSLEETLKRHEIDLIVLGTHGRTGAAKFLLGSVAEEIFRRSPVPVLTIGPSVRSGAHNGARFHRVLYATDFTPESLAAAPYAISFAQENEAELLLLHVIHERERGEDAAREAATVADAMYNLGELVPKDAELWCKPETIVQYGVPAERVLELAKQHGADLIVLGVRDAAKRMGAATHLERTTAHKVVAHATCPVLTVRG